MDFRLTFYAVSQWKEKQQNKFLSQTGCLRTIAKNILPLNFIKTRNKKKQGKAPA